MKIIIYKDDHTVEESKFLTLIRKKESHGRILKNSLKFYHLSWTSFDWCKKNYIEKLEFKNQNFLFKRKLKKRRK